VAVRAQYLAFAAEFGGAFAQGDQPDAGRGVGWDAGAVVGDRNRQLGPVGLDADPAGGRGGVPGDVGEGLRGDAVGGDLDRGG